MNRTCGLYETYCKALYENYNGDGTVLTIARIDGPLDFSLLKKALLTFQERHPLLQAQAGLNGKSDCFTFDLFKSLSQEEKLQNIPLDRIPRNDDFHWESIGNYLMEQRIEDHSKYLWRFMFLEGNGVHELFLYSRHDISDARSTALLMSQLLEQCSQMIQNPDMRMAPLELFPCIESILDRPPHMESVDNPEPASDSWPYDNFVQVSDRKPILVFRQIESTDMARIKSATKDHDITINSALAAALLISQFEVLCPSRQKLNVKFNTAISLRPYCAPPLGDEHFGSYVMNLVTNHWLDRDLDFWQFAKDYGQVLLSSLKQTQMSGFLPQTCDRAEISNGLAEDEKTLKEVQGFLTPMITNSGLLKFPEHYGLFRLKEVYVGTKQVFGDCGIVLSAITLHGRLLLFASTCEPLLSRFKVEKIVDSVIAKLSAVSGL